MVSLRTETSEEKRNRIGKEIDMKIHIDRKRNLVHIYTSGGDITLSIKDAYLLASHLMQELDKTNPLLSD